MSIVTIILIIVGILVGIGGIVLTGFGFSKYSKEKKIACEGKTVADDECRKADNKQAGFVAGGILTTFAGLLMAGVTFTMNSY